MRGRWARCRWLRKINDTSRADKSKITAADLKAGNDGSGDDAIDAKVVASAAQKVETPPATPPAQATEPKEEPVEPLTKITVRDQ